jgi:hypothetical protein
MASLATSVRRQVAIVTRTELKAIGSLRQLLYLLQQSDTQIRPALNSSLLSGSYGSQKFMKKVKHEKRGMVRMETLSTPQTTSLRNGLYRSPEVEWSSTREELPCYGRCEEGSCSKLRAFYISFENTKYARRKLVACGNHISLFLSSTAPSVNNLQ